MKEIRIDNSKQSAVKSGKWKNPGSSFYYKILNSFTIADPKRSEEDPDRYDFDFRKVLQEAYLVAPVEKIKNTPYGITPYSQSGCKYPHHAIRNGKLVVSIPGIQAAYARAKQQGIYKGKVKEHIDRHYKEMGLTMSAMTESVDPIQDQIDDNFESIQRYLEESLNISFVHPDVVLESTEQVDPQQAIQETFDWMDRILYQSDEDYNESVTDEMMLSHIDESIQKMNDFIDDVIHREVEIENMIIDTAPCTRIDFTSQKAMFESAERCLFGEKSHGSLRYDYRVGIDVDAARLVAVKFKLVPELVTAAGNMGDMNLAIQKQGLNPSVEKQLMILRNQLKKARTSGNLAAAQMYTNAIQDLINVFARRNLQSAGAALQKIIRKEGHVDHVTNASTVDSIFHPDGNNMNFVRMIGSLSEPIRDFQRHIVAKYGIDRLKPFMVTTTRSFANDSTIKWTFSLVALFEKCNTADNTFIRNEFKRFIKSYASHFETYKVGTPGGGDKYKSTKLVWDMNRFQQTMSIAPKFRGSFPKPSTPDREIDVVNTYDHYNALNTPRFAEVPKRKLDDMIHEEGPWIDDDTKYALKHFENMERIFNDVIQAIDEFLERKGIHWTSESISDDETIFNLDINTIDDDSTDPEIDEDNELDEADIEELDFEEKYSAIDATGSEWNEFWSLFERGELHKTKSQMINYYNQYLEYIESIGNSSSDEIANAHQYKEKIDEMRSDPEYDSWMRRMDLDDMLYAEYRLSQLKPISDEEFIEELLENKAGMLALTDPDDTELIERYQNEIAYLIDCKLNSSVALDKDAINWEYLNLIQYGMNEAVNVDALMRQTSNFIENHFSTAIIHYQDIALPYLLKSYILYERTSTIPDVKYSYRMGIDVDTGKLVAIKFKLEPDKITEANANHHKFLNKDGKVTTLVDTLKNVITRTGHIDFVSSDNEIVGTIYRDGKAYTMKNGKGKKVRILPVQSEQVGEFLGRMCNYDPDLMQKFTMRNPSNYIPRNQDDGRVISLTAAFADPKVQNLFISFVKQFHYQPEVYEIGKTCGPNKYQSTRVLWNNLLLYRKLGDTPQFRGPILDLEVKSINKFNPKTQKYDINYTGMGSPEFIKKESYESGNLNTIIADIKTNIKKYEEVIQEYISTSNQFSMDLSSYLEADDQSEENDPVEDDDTPPNIDLGDEEITSDEPPTIDTDEPESTEEDPPTEDETEENPKEDTTNEAPNIIEPTSLPKAADAQETDKNGVNRKKLYIAFIEWAKSYNARNTFGSLFDKDVFDVTYPFVPHEMRYFYRLANPILCVLSGKLTFFQVSELRKLNADNPDMKDALIFAATEDDYRAFSTRDKRVYLAVDKPDGSGIQFTRALADSFDLYLQNMIGKGDILHGDVDSSTDSGTDRGDHSDENGE